MIKLRKSNERGTGDQGWLLSRNTFSFGAYYDCACMGAGPLRVINEDWVKPSMGFGMHEHREVEIVTWMMSGAMCHEDGLGNSAILQAGDLQRMTAGTGIRHDERNPSPQARAHFFQIWLEPDRKNLPPSYQRAHFDTPMLHNTLRQVAGVRPPEGAVTLHLDASLWIGRLDEHLELTHRVEPGRMVWVQLTLGQLRLNDVEMNRGDGAGVCETGVLSLHARAFSEVLLFDLPAP